MLNERCRPDSSNNSSGPGPTDHAHLWNACSDIQTWGVRCATGRCHLPHGEAMRPDSFNALVRGAAWPTLTRSSAPERSRISSTSARLCYEGCGTCLVWGLVGVGSGEVRAAPKAAGDRHEQQGFARSPALMSCPRMLSAHNEHLAPDGRAFREGQCLSRTWGQKNHAVTTVRSHAGPCDTPRLWRRGHKPRYRPRAAPTPCLEQDS